MYKPSIYEDAFARTQREVTFVFQTATKKKTQVNLRFYNLECNSSNLSYFPCSPLKSSYEFTKSYQDTNNRVWISHQR